MPLLVKLMLSRKDKTRQEVKTHSVPLLVKMTSYIVSETRQAEGKTQLSVSTTFSETYVKPTKIDKR